MIKVPLASGKFYFDFINIIPLNIHSPRESMLLIKIILSTGSLNQQANELGDQTPLPIITHYVSRLSNYVTDKAACTGRCKIKLHTKTK